LRDLGKLEEARASFQMALSLRPNYVNGHLNLGTVLWKLGRLDEAEACFRKVISLRPDFPEAHNNLGLLLNDKGKIKEAIGCFQKAISINPEFADAYNSLAGSLRSAGELESALENNRKAIELKPNNSVEHSNVLYTLTKIPGVFQKKMYAESLQWCRQHTGSLPDLPAYYENNMKAGRPLRVGYVSADFRNHSMSFFIEPLVEAHNRERVQVYCYANVKEPDEVTERIKNNADGWRLITGMNDEKVAGQIRKDKIDILVDLSGHTAGNRLLVFARKPAPVQVTWLGYVNTTGLSTIDYHLTDKVTMPEGEDEYYSESAYRLPECFFCYKPHPDSPDVQDSPLHEKGSVTFGSVNDLTKINPSVVELWSRVLKEVMGSRLLLQAAKFNDEYIKNRYFRLFAEHNIGPERIEIVAGLSRNDFLAIHNRIDICLDPFPFNGLFTTCDSLWMGVPVITLRGRRYHGRMAASALSCLGMQELIAESKEEYLEKAVLLAGNPDRLIYFRKNLRDLLLRSPICDYNSFVHSVEESYQDMWKTFCAKNS